MNLRHEHVSVLHLAIDRSGFLFKTINSLHDVRVVFCELVEDLNA